MASRDARFLVQSRFPKNKLTLGIALLRWLLHSQGVDSSSCVGNLCLQKCIEEPGDQR